MSNDTPPSKMATPEEKPSEQPSQPAESPIPRIFGLTLITAISMELARLYLSPVYGSSPTLYHFNWELNLIALVFITNSELSIQHQKYLVSAIPFLGCAIPTILSQSFQFSGYLGPSWGPTVTSLFTVLPLMYLSLVQVLQDNVELAKQSPGLMESLGPYPTASLLIAAWGTLYMFRRVAVLVLQFCISTFGLMIFTRFGMQTVLSLVFAQLSPSKFRYWMIALALLTIFNTHVPAVWNDGRLHAVLAEEGYAMVARQESVTGYISVLDNVKDGYRVMRCDHSLLGGEWLKKEVGSTSKLNEPVYAIFVMLEAVRLVETKSMKKLPAKPDSEKTALVIGLGIGTTPTALITHNITTTTIELDPIVHTFATQYFHLPSHNSIIANAISAVKTLQPASYDYIIHDVFTGGVEPLDLFTLDFLTNLKTLLTPEGTIAINYAGDLRLPVAAAAVATILATFPTCRIFRESPIIDPSLREDFTNMVLFCRNSGNESFTFRKPTSKDFLGSGARKEFLLPKYEMHAADTFGIDRMEAKNGTMITKQTIKSLNGDQEKSRQGHWRVMRGVMPDRVWENW